MGTAGRCLAVGGVSDWVYGAAWVVGDECGREHEEEYGECDGVCYVLCGADCWCVFFFPSLPFPSLPLSSFLLMGCRATMLQELRSTLVPFGDRGHAGWIRPQHCL